MAEIDLEFADDTTQQLTLPSVDGIQHIPIIYDGTAINVPFERFILANESVVFIFVLSAFISSGILKNQNPVPFRMGFGLNKDAMVVPEKNTGDVWNFKYNIRFNNDKSNYSVIEVIFGTLPPGLEVDATATSTDRVQLDGKVSGAAFGANTWQGLSASKDTTFEDAGFYDAKLELLDIKYVEGIHHTPTVIENPTDVFVAGDTILNGAGDDRIISSISTYEENSVTKTKLTVPYVVKMNRGGFSRYEAFDIPGNKIVKSDRLSIKKDSNFKGYITGSGRTVYYTDVKTVIETSSALIDQTQKDYTFTLGMRSSVGTTYFAQQEFTIRVLQNFDQVRDEFQGFSGYPDVDIYYDPTLNAYIVDYTLPLIKSDGSSTSILIDDGNLPFNVDNTIEAFGTLPFYQNDDGKRVQNDITLGVSE